MCMCMCAQVGLLRFLYQAHTLDAQHSTMLDMNMSVQCCVQVLWVRLWLRGVSARRKAVKYIVQGGGTSYVHVCVVGTAGQK